MNDQMPEVEMLPPSKPLPRSQAYLLMAILLGYPILSIAMNLLKTTDQTKVVSRITQIYLPSIFIQILMITVIVIILHRTGAKLADIGLGKSDITWSNVLSGMIFFIGAWAVIMLIKGTIERSGYIPEKDFLYLLPKTLSEKTFWLFLSIGAAISEEITFRGYVISRLKLFSGFYWPGVILSSLAFSLGHLYQGLAGVVLTFIYGMLFAGLYVARGSVFPCIVAHFMQDAMILLAFRA
jgi:membrane protease YdiL (CAAX protease family)